VPANTPRRRPRARQGEGEHLRTELIDAARRILAETGRADAVTLRGVARAVGVSAPSIYLHFEDRDDLLRAVLLNSFERFGRALLDAPTTGHPAGDLRAGCLAYLTFARHSDGAYAVLFSGIVDVESLLPGTHRPGMDDPGGEPGPGLDAFENLVTAFQVAIDQGVVAGRGARSTAVKVWTHLHGAAGLRRAMPGFGWVSDEELVDEMLADLAGIEPPVPDG
jgi:AcrR family transcriptional regulator